jgi:hypothetical protein
MTDSAIRFVAEIIKVQTKNDHAIRFTLDLPETEYKAAVKLMEAYQSGALLECAVIPIIADKLQTNDREIHI